MQKLKYNKIRCKPCCFVTLCFSWNTPIGIFLQTTGSIKNASCEFSKYEMPGNLPELHLTWFYNFSCWYIRNIWKKYFLSFFFYIKGKYNRLINILNKLEEWNQLLLNYLTIFQNYPNHAGSSSAPKIVQLEQKSEIIANVASCLSYDANINSKIWP